MSKKTILLIEDNPGDRAIYGNMLWYNGFDVVFAEDGETGLRLANELRPNLILLDLMLPVLPGSEVSSQLKQDDATKDIPIVALTARVLSDFGGNASILGFARFLEKPVSPLEVLRAVEHIIGPSVIDQAQAPHPPELIRARHEAGVRELATPPTTTASDEVRAIAQDVVENTTEVLAEWERLVREEPWFSLPREDRMGFMQEILVSLSDVALLSRHEPESCRKTVTAAAAHGRNRRAQQIPESLIPIEFHLLRRAIWRYLTQNFSPSDDLHNAILAIDSSISLALNACMWGYFRDEIEAQGMWEIAVDRLVESACDVANRNQPAKIIQ